MAKDEQPAVKNADESRRSRGKLVAALGVGLGLLLLVLWWAWDRDGVMASSNSATQPKEAGSARVLANGRQQQAEFPTEREKVASDDTPAGNESGLAHVRGRCVAAKSHEPLAGCRVRFFGDPANPGKMALHGEVLWKAPRTVVTGTDGFFEVSFMAMPPYQHSLDIQAFGRAPRTARWGAFVPGQVEDLGDIEMALGYRVAGTVVDTAGNLVPKARVMLCNLPLPIQVGMAANTRRGAISDASGRFQIKEPIPAGAWPVDVWSAGMKLVSPRTLTVSNRDETVTVEVVLKPMPKISGVCVDEQGQPVVKAYVRGRDSRAGSSPAAYTDNEGRFTLYALDDGLQPVRLQVSEGGCEPIAEESRIEWGRTDVRLVLKRCLSFELAVVERETGKPVEDYCVRCASMEPGVYDPGLRLGGHHPGGLLTVANVVRGRNRLLVIPKSECLDVSDEVFFDATDAGIPAMRIALDRQRPFDVRVVTKAGAPVAGSTVDLLRVGTGRLEVDVYHARTDHRHGEWISRGEDWRLPELLWQTKTDAQGIGQVFVPPGDAELALHATGPHLPVIRRNVVFVEGTPLEIVVDLGASLTGRIDLHGIPKQGASIYLIQDAGGNARQVASPVARDGTFAVEHVPPGAYALHLAVTDTFVPMQGGGGSITKVLKPALRQVEIVDGETQHVELSARQFRVGSLEGRVFLDGTPAKHAGVAAEVVSGCSWGTSGHFVPDRDGQFTARLFPGTYRMNLVIRDPAADSTWICVSPDEVVVPVGQTVARTFHFVRRVVKVRALQADGKMPIPNSKCAVSGKWYSDTPETDAAGWVTLTAAPFGKIHVRIKGYEPRTIDVPAEKKESVFQVRFEQKQ